ncbi:hypothetical protein LTR70_007119 [Exophiala xenobiotica]|uniref:Ribophorin II C-terminal domain-containing protein n=1 Tax=Lithohypha guttulata TaxID=1690604 RepID=A0ABR0K6Q6_9EURO|nr:hypothetical protein LTR24_006316 [Lithohypha guttulata]KAK5314490.1 hypothetical protein LTR70_007119 [Exophiala xenobiotica]
MRLLKSLLGVSILAVSVTNSLAASWTFADASVSVQSKGTGVGGGRKDSLTPGKPLAKTIDLGPTDSLKVILTTQEGKSAKRPHQASLLLKDSSSNLDVSYPLSVKESGKAKVDLTQKELPTQFLKNQSKVSASLVIASFGSSTGYNVEAFTLNVISDKGVPAGTAEKPLRYGKLPEIHHIFRADPKSPNVLISTVFTLGAIAALPILLGAWLFLGGNINHFSKAMSDAPLAHALFVGSIIGLEGILFMYYSTWNLFQTLPALLAVGMVTFVSGSRALTEVQDRRLAGQR